MSDVLQMLKCNDRYKTFTFLNEPVLFKEYFKGKKYYVQVHDMTPIRALVTNPKVDCPIVGFAGCFNWDNNTLTPADGDIYNEDLHIYGYEEFVTSEGEKGLNILTNDW